MKILAVSDIELPNLYSPILAQRFGDVDFIIGCGDLAYYYLEYMISTLNKPLYYVNGNHAPAIEYGEGGERTYPHGGINIHRLVLREPASGLILAGIEGCVRYNDGVNQYTQAEMWWLVRGLVPRLFLNRIFFGRYLDVFVSHAPPWKINDQEDLPHQGIKAFIWLNRRFQPAYHLHGHVHLYRQDAVRAVPLGKTQVINVCGYQVIDLGEGSHHHLEGRRRSGLRG